MNIKTLTSLALSLATLPLLADVSPVYPRPQQCELQQATTRVKDIHVVLRELDSSAEIWSRIPEKSGAYAICIEPDKLTVYAHDNAGAYYARQTLSQLLVDVPGARDAQADPFPTSTLQEIAQMGELPLGTIIDWPDLPWRGTVEGYYGTPWSYAARMSQFAFYGRNKMNTYIYAPKDDPYHHGIGVYKPYPEEKANEIRELVREAARHHVNFVWAIHPANTVKWKENGGKNQLEALLVKLQQMYDLGVRSFAVLVDDSSGEIGKPQRQVQLTNYILENFIRKHPDVNQTLIMCPTGYNRSWTNANFLNTIGDGLDPSIPIMWTGDTVVHDITLPGQQWVNEHVRRPTFIWWNWPCSDFKRSRLSMGRTYGLDTAEQMRDEMSGFVANPMEHAEASKVGVFGVADYTWNISGFESDSTWKEGIQRLYPIAADAMQVFCNHNSYLLPNGHGYFREESVAFQDTAKALVQSIENGRIDRNAAAVMEAEYANMRRSADILLNAEGITPLQQEIDPWLQQFRLTAVAGESIMRALNAKDDDFYELFYNCIRAQNDMKSTTRPEWNNGEPTRVDDVEVAMHTMTPVMRKTFQHLNHRVYAELSGRKTEKPRFISSCGKPEVNPEHVLDGNMNTFWSNDQMQEVGQWYGYDFGSPTEMHNICLVMGGARGADFAAEGQFEISNDGRTWEPIGTPKEGPMAILNLAKQPVLARMIRFRITKANRKWLSICEFAINRTLPPYVSSNIIGKRLTAYSVEGMIGISRVMEYFPIENGEFISLELPRPIKPLWLEINLENADIMEWGKLTFTMEDGTEKEITAEVVKNRIYLEDIELPEGRITAVTFRNEADAAESMKITIFRVGVPSGTEDTDPAMLTDGDVSTPYMCGKAPLDVTLPIPAGCKEVVLVGNARCKVEGTFLQKMLLHQRIYRLRPDATEIRITSPQKANSFLNEVIFR